MEIKGWVKFNDLSNVYRFIGYMVTSGDILVKRTLAISKFHGSGLFFCVGGMVIPVKRIVKNPNKNHNRWEIGIYCDSRYYKTT